MRSNLMSSGRIGSLTLKNRVIMPAMGNSLSNGIGDAVDDPKAYYQERAKGGVGLIITGVCRVTEDGAAIANQLSAFHVSHAGGLKKIADGVHRYDGRIFLQLHHAGRQANPMVTGTEPVGPSPIAVIPGFSVPRELSTEEVKVLVGKFIFAAVIAKLGNFDGVEVHAAHGYMLNQFLSSYSNHRTDEYGGSLDNRLRIVKEIIEGIKSQCGPDFPISVRISADEFVDGGIKIDEAIVIAQKLEQFGADMINVSGGGYQTMFGIIAPSMYEQGWMVPLAAAIKKVVKIPVGAVSQIRSPEFADDLIKDGKCDFVCMGRPHIADPYIVNKIKTGREKEIRRCIGCLKCADELNSSRLACSVNPVVGFEKDFTHFERNGAGRVVAVIGGGPGGCEAARVLAERGFSVTLFEKSDCLGGQIRLAAVPPTKFRMEWLIEYYTYNLQRLGVDVKLNTDATLSDIEVLNPYAVFLATGSTSIIPPVPGVDSDNVCTSESLLAGEIKLSGKNILIVGSGNTGLETAEFLLTGENTVTLADMLPKVGMLANTSGGYTLYDLMAKGVEMIPNHMLKKIEGNKVTLLNLTNNELTEKEFDNIVLSLGVRKFNVLEDDFCKKFSTVRVVADAYQVGNIGSSVKSGFQKAFLLDNEGDEL